MRLTAAGARSLLFSLWRSKRRQRGAGRGEDPAGFALILVLCVLAVLSVIAVTLIRETREETSFESAVIEDAKAEALAEGAVQQSMLELLVPPGNGAWQADGSLHEIRFGEGVVVVRIEDESGRIDLNHAELPLLVAMLTSVGESQGDAEHLAAAIVDYRDPDSVKTPGGAEAPDYEAAGRSHGPKNGPFDTPEELMQVLGMTSEIARALYPMVTVYSPNGEVNRRAASPAVLKALSLMGFADGSSVSASQDAGALSVATVVRITAEARTRGGGHFIREAVLQRTTVPVQPFTILSWRRRWPLSR
jgi:general secretion pathway protein K